jgi:hypothetical protein
MQWLVAGFLVALWLVGLLMHKGGFIHMLLLSAIALMVVRFVAEHRAAPGRGLKG